MSQSEKLLEEFPIPTYSQWLELVEKQLKGAPFEKKLVTRLPEGVSIKPIYLKSDYEGLEPNRSLPGFSPYVRNNTATGSVKEGWKISQQYTYPYASLFNESVVDDLKRGLNTIMLVVDQAGKQGLDPDQADLRQIGMGGLSVCSLEDVETALKDINPTDTGILIDAGSSSFAIICLLAAHLKARNHNAGTLQGGVVFDPLSSAASCGVLPRSPWATYAEMAAMIHWKEKHAPSFKPIGIDARPYADSGGSVVHELGLAIAAAVEYIRELQQRGLSIDQIASAMCLFLGTGANFFLEIAKLRAARMLWSKIIKEFQGKESSAKLTIHSCSTQWNKTIHDPHVNILRATTEAYASILGGCDTLSIAPFDILLGMPNNSSRRISRNIQMILKEECHGHKVIDPAGGSWFVENLTEELCEKSWDIFQEIEGAGGYQSALEQGIPQELIKETHQMKKAQVAKRKQVIVGTNMYPNLEEVRPPIQSIDMQTFSRTRADQIRKWKSGRGEFSREIMPSATDVQQPNFMDQLMSSVAKGLTLGEINSILSKNTLPFRISNRITVGRLAEEYEDLRRKAEAYKAETGEYPKVFLANMGPLRQHKARADFAAGFFQPGGFSAIYSEGLENVKVAASAAIASRAKIVVICSTDETYPDLVPILTDRIKERDPDICVVVTGYPVDHIESFREAGVDDFIHLKADNLQCLKQFQERAGV